METLENKIDKITKAFNDIEESFKDGLITSNEYYMQKLNLIEIENWKFAIKSNNIIKELAQKQNSKVIIEYVKLENKILAGWIDGIYSIENEKKLLSIRRDIE
jgi:hypothetical protein